MPRWYVEIFVGQDIKHIGEPFVRKESQEVLTFLTTCLTEPSFTIIKDDNYHFWISSDFDTLNNEEEVYQYAQNQLPFLNGIMQIKFATNICTIQVGDIYHPDNDGLLTRNT